MLTLIGGIVILGILVFVHELGHFCVAKFAGVKVLKFSLGFGPRLVSRQWGETEYLICAIPLGGYVLMLGEGNGENGEGAELTPEEQARSYAHKPVGIRTAIIAAGPLMNLLLPFVVLPMAYLLGVEMPAYLDRPPCIGLVVSGSTAEQAGFRTGDCLLRLNGDRVTTWDEANTTLVAHAGTPLQVVVARGTSETTLNLADAGVEGLQPLGLFPEQAPVVGALASGMPAEQAGLKVGDRIIAIDAEPITSWYDLKRVIQATQGKACVLQVTRGTEQLSLTLQPSRSEQGGEYLIGIAPLEETVHKRFSPLQAIEAGWKRSLELIQLTCLFIAKMVTGNVSTSSIGGPISVVQMAGHGSLADVSLTFLKLAFISIQLGILNLLPIPVLDGGHLFFNLIELVLRRPVSLRTREIAQQIGLTLLLLLMVLAFYNDLKRVFFGG